MILSHRIALDPNQKQRDYFTQAAGTARFTWNWALTKWNELYAAGKKPTGHKLLKIFNSTKYRDFPWLKGISKHAHSQPFLDLQRAFVRFFKKIARRPKFKRKGKTKDSFYVANDRLGHQLGDMTIRLPVIGHVRLTEPLRFQGKIMAAVVSRQAQRWFISIRVDVGDYSKPRTGNDTVGVDLGLTPAVILSTGEEIEAPKPLKSSPKRLRHHNKSLHRKQKGSANREKQKLKLARVHARVRNIRHDFLHKTTAKLCRENQAVAIEDLCVKGMMRNRKLARAILDIGWGELRRQLEYKAPIYGGRVLVVDRFFPSTKMCSRCGHVKKEMPLSERVYVCEKCGLVIDRNVNAAINLRTAGLAGLQACGENVSPGASQAVLVEAGTNPTSSIALGET